MAPEPCLICQPTARAALDPRTRALAEAKEYLEACMRVANCTRAEAQHIEKTSIGYWTGYCAHPDADRVMRLFDCEHPYFGKGHPTPEEIFAMGLRLGRKLRRERASLTRQAFTRR